MSGTMQGPWTKYAATSAEAGGPWTKYAAPATPSGSKQSKQLAGGTQPANPGWLKSAAAGAGEGMGDAALGMQQLAGKILSGVGADRAGNWLQQDATKGVANLKAEAAPYQQANPISTDVGNFVGQSVPAIAGAETLAGGALGGAAKSTIAGRLATGSLSGGLAAAANPVTGGDYWWSKAKDVAKGAAEGFGASLAGEGVASGIERAVRPSADALMGKGIRMTPGQLMGGVVKKAEDALTSVPIVGNIVSAGQRKSIEDFNEAAINHSLAPIGEKLTGAARFGHAAIDQAATKLSGAYEKLLPNMIGNMDKEYEQDINGVQQLAMNLPMKEKAQLGSIINDEIVGKFTAAGRTTGHSVKEIESTLGRLATGFMRSDDYDVQRLGGAVKELQASTRRMVERINPGQNADLQKINAGWANLLRVQRAAGMQGAEEGVFTPSQLVSAVRGLDSSKNKASYSRGNALLQNFAEDARKVLPNKTPNSGTADRAMWAMMAGIGGSGATEHSVVTPLILAALSAPYTGVGMRAVNAAAAPATRNYLAGLARGVEKYPAAGAATIGDSRQQ